MESAAIAPMSAPMDMDGGLLERGLLMLSLRQRLMLMLTTMATMDIETLDTPPLDTTPCPTPGLTPMPLVPSSPPAWATDLWVMPPVLILDTLMVPTPPLDEQNYSKIPTSICNFLSDPVTE